MMVRRGRRSVCEGHAVRQQPLQGLLHPPRMLRRRQDALLQIRLPTRPGEAAGETDLLEIVHLEPQERIGRLDLGGVHGAAAERGLGRSPFFALRTVSAWLPARGAEGCSVALRALSFVFLAPSFLLYTPLRFCALVAAMEVERDSEEGAFVTEDVSAIIKEVRLPGRPTGPRQRSQGVP